MATQLRPEQSGKQVNEGQESLGDLVSRLTSQTSHLAQQQVDLVQAEMRESANDIKQGIAGLLSAAVLGIAGLGVTLMGISYLIGDALGDRDLATLIVGLAVMAIAGIMYAGAKSKMDADNLKPTRTIETAERTPEVARGNAHKSTETNS